MIKKLESIRGFAAVYVMIHHYIGFSALKQQLHPLARLPFRFGQEAVILFFLLSGFVIYYSHHGKTLDTRSYMLKRFRRIYPIAICSFLLSVTIHICNGRRLATNDAYNLLGNLLMLQDTNNKPGQWFDVFLENHALWSLSYEWIFYILFLPFMKYIWKLEHRMYWVAGFSAVSWLLYISVPNHICLVFSYFIIWWCGVEAAALFIRHKDFTLKLMWPMLLGLLVVTLLATIPIVVRYVDGRERFSQIMYPIITFRHFFFALLVLLVGLVWWRLRLVGFGLLNKFRVFAPTSYAVYIIHFPILWLEIPFIENIYIQLLVKISLVFVLAYLLEAKMQKVIQQKFRIS